MQPQKDSNLACTTTWLQLRLLHASHASHRIPTENEIRIFKTSPELARSPCATIDYQHFPIDIIPRIREQVHCRIRNLFYRPVPIQWYPSTLLRSPRGLCRQPLHTLGPCNRPRRNNITRDTIGPVFDCDICRDTIHGGFGGYDVRLELLASIVESGRDGDNAAAGTGCRGCAIIFVLLCGGDDVWEGSFHGVVGAYDIDVYDRFEGVWGELGDGGEEVAGCAASVTEGRN